MDNIQKNNIQHKHISVVCIDKRGSIKTEYVELEQLTNLPKELSLQTEWSVSIDNSPHPVYISLYANDHGTANNENKYEFPPPVDTKLFFGTCLLVGSANKTYISLTTKRWKKIYNKLYGGFYDLNKTAQRDELEVDELDTIPKHKKTKIGGYLKDGFVVDG
jgi:hypothetical protein